MIIGTRHVLPLLFLTLSACAATDNHYRTIDTVFPSDAIRTAALDDLAADIRTRGAGPVVILVKYALKEPLSGSQSLAQLQGETVRDYLLRQNVPDDFEILTSPAPLQVNRIWVSYQQKPERPRTADKAAK